MMKKTFIRVLRAIMITVLLVAIASQYYFKRLFAEKLQNDYAEYDSTFDLSIPFIVKHSVQFSKIDGCENTYVYIFGYHRIVETTTIIFDPIITVPAS
jgi:hypothetical protein